MRMRMAAKNGIVRIRRSPIVDLKLKWSSFMLVVHASSRAHPFL